MKSYRNSLVALLVLLVTLPLNTAAASWMTLSMPEHDADRHAGLELNSADSHHHDAAVDHHGNATLDSQVSGADACDDHCMSCSSHCFSAALTAIPGEIPDLNDSVSISTEGESLSRAYLLFRPPIAATRIRGWSVAVR